MVVQSNQGIQTESGANMANGGISFNNTNDETRVNYPQVDTHTLEENIVSEMRNGVVIGMTAVETRVPDAVLTAIESLELARVESALKTANASSGRSLNDNIMEPDQKDFSGNKAYK